jgi:hypothetical protein
MAVFTAPAAADGKPPAAVSRFHFVDNPGLKKSFQGPVDAHRVKINTGQLCRDLLLGQGIFFFQKQPEQSEPAGGSFQPGSGKQLRGCRL